MKPILLPYLIGLCCGAAIGILLAGMFPQQLYSQPPATATNSTVIMGNPQLYLTDAQIVLKPLGSLSHVTAIRSTIEIPSSSYYVQINGLNLLDGSRLIVNGNNNIINDVYVDSSSRIINPHLSNNWFINI
jgi:hypothetical protein